MGVRLVLFRVDDADDVGYPLAVWGDLRITHFAYPGDVVEFQRMAGALCHQHGCENQDEQEYARRVFAKHGVSLTSRELSRQKGPVTSYTDVYSSNIIPRPNIIDCSKYSFTTGSPLMDSRDTGVPNQLFNFNNLSGLPDLRDC